MLQLLSSWLVFAFRPRFRRLFLSGWLMFPFLLVSGLAHAQNRDLVRADEGVTTRAALVIGNTNYEYKPLKNPVNDARAMAASLTKLGFKVTLKFDLNLIEMREVANAWADSLDSHTLALVYYSGHGVTNNGQNYLVPVNNAQITHKRDVPDLAYPFQRLLDATKEQGCPLRIFILDACRNDPLPKGLKGDDGQSGLTKVAAPTGAFIAYAAGFGETASDNGDGTNGLYTAALLKNIQTPGLPIEVLFKRVRGAVLQSSGGEQHPDESSQLVGDFCFSGTVNIGGGGAAPAPKGSSSADYLGRGSEFYGAGKYELALASYTFALEADPNNAEAYYSRALTYRKLNQFDKVIADCNEFIRMKPDDYRGFNQRAIAYNDGLKQYDKALADVTEAIRLKPDNSVLYSNRAWSYRRLDQYDKALADMSDAIRLKATDYRYFIDRGMILRVLKQYDKSLADYAEAIRLKPDEADAYNGRGWANDDAQKYVEAIADYTEAIRLRPTFYAAYTNRAIVYRELKQFDKALSDCNEAVRIKPDNDTAFNLRGNIYYVDLQQNEKSLTEYSEAIRIKSDYGVYYGNRGSAYYNLKQYDKALADYQRYAQLDAKAPDWVAKKITELQNRSK